MSTDNDDDYVAPPIDRERMDRALAGPRVMLPQGLSRDEICAFINGAAAAFEAKESHVPQALAILRHAYEQLRAGAVNDTATFADGLIAPAIRMLELESKPPEIPA